MRQLITFLFIATFGMSSFANNLKKQTLLSIVSTDQSALLVQINGKDYPYKDNDFQFNGLNPGKTTVRVFKQKKFGLLGSRYEIVYNQSLHLRPNTHTTIAIDKHGRARTSETLISNIFKQKNNKDCRNDNDYEDERRQNRPHGRNNNRYTNHEFENDLAIAQREASDDKRAIVLSNIVDKYSITSDQLIQMIHSLNHDYYKVEVAARAYKKLMDKQNFNAVCREISNQYYRQELERRTMN